SLPIDWELSYFGHTGVDPLADPDGDGMDNFAEFRAGTDPNDALSGLRFTEIRAVTNGVRLRWMSADNRAYALQRSSSLSGEFADIQTAIGGAAPMNTYIDTNALAAGPFFYRLRIDDAMSVAAGGPLKLTAIQKDPQGGIRIYWVSGGNHTYAVQRCSNLQS